jgi:hypothetical protein
VPKIVPKIVPRASTRGCLVRLSAIALAAPLVCGRSENFISGISHIEAPIAMTLSIAKESSAGIVITADTNATPQGLISTPIGGAVKVKVFPTAKVALSWHGDFNQSPLILCEPFANGALGADRSQIEIAEAVLETLNKAQHIHPNGKEAGVLVYSYGGGVPGAVHLKATGGKGSWNVVGSVGLAVAAGYLEPLGLQGTVANIDCSLTKQSEIETWAAGKIVDANQWLVANHLEQVIGAGATHFLLAAPSP